MDAVLKEIYYSPSKAGSFSGINSLYREAKKRLPTIKQCEVKNWLENQYVYSLHKPVRKKFPRNKVYSRGINDLFQIDLADMQNLAVQNNGYKYLFNCICVFSKYAWSIPVKNKTGKEMVRALRFVILRRKPHMIQTDEGMEFKNKVFQEFLEANKIKHYTSKNREIKAAVVERFNRTIKTKLWKHFTKTRSYRYVEVLPDLVKGYNKSYHRSIKMAPINVKERHTADVHKRLYGTKPGMTKFKFNVGNRVRVSKVKGRFEKGYLPNWSEEMFTVQERLSRKPPMYRLQDYNGDPIEGLWYEQELQASSSEKYWIDEIIKRQKGMALVKWTGYPESFNSWIPISNIERYG